VPVFKRPHFEKLLSLASRGRIAPLYLLAGDLVVAEELLRRLSSHFQALGHEVQKVDLGGKSFEELKALFGGPGLLGRKIFLLKGAEGALKQLDQDFVLFLEKAKSWLTILLAFPEIKENHPLYLYALEKGVFMPLPSKGRRDLVRYEIPELLASLGKKMDRRTAEELLALVGEDLEALGQELLKLALYVGERPEITLEDVKTVVSPRSENAPYLIMEAFLREGPPGALKMIEEILGQGTHPLVISKTLVTHFKRLYLFSELLEKEPELAQQGKYFQFRESYQKALKKVFPERVPKDLTGLHPFAAFKMLPLARAFSPEKFNIIFSALLRLDGRLKRGGLPLEEFYLFFLVLERELKTLDERGWREPYAISL